MANAELDVGRMRLLRAVSLRGTIAAAARELGLTASAVSQQLAVLEREAGTALVDRSPRGVTLTAAGHAVASRAGEVLEVLAAARADLDRIGSAIGGPVRVAAVASAALRIVSPAVVSVARRHPDISVAVTVAEPARAFGLVLAGEADLAVVDEYDYVPLALPEFMQARALLTEPMVAVVPDGWDGPRRPALTDLAGADWVMPPADAACGLAVRSACRAAGFEPRVRWVSDDMVVLARAVADGHGVAVLPRLSVVTGEGDGEARPDLRTLALRGRRLRRRITAVGRASALTRPAVTVVCDALAGAARRR